MPRLMMPMWLANLALISPAAAADGLDGRGLGLVWGVPFAGLLLTMAVLPLLAQHLWEHHYGKIAAGWALATLLPMAIILGGPLTLEALLHALWIEYLPFIVLLFTLYTVAGGILIRGSMRATPLSNAGILAFGTLIASIVGTTGASMILIRPLIRANAQRRHNVHVVIFFIFLVSNIGGSLTPLGDPPLFVGFLRGVDFFWTTRHLFTITLLASVLLLGIFIALDAFLLAREPEGMLQSSQDTAEPLSLHGGLNILLLIAVIGAILLASTVRTGVYVGGAVIGRALEEVLRDIALLAIAATSIRLTPKAVRSDNGFNWAPIAEVAKLFAAIFICIIPVLAMLSAGKAGALAPLANAVSDAAGSPSPVAYFWATGLLSAVLDNAPTYLAFFELAGGDATALMGPGHAILTAISVGAVFMGALTYIGNAPNMMVAAIARDMDIPMPGFAGYALWSCAILLPLFTLISVLLIGRA